jgi:hypothetical protein
VIEVNIVLSMLLWCDHIIQINIIQLLESEARCKQKHDVADDEVEEKSPFKRMVGIHYK